MSTVPPSSRHATAPRAGDAASGGNPVSRLAWRTAGAVFIAIGLVNAFVPLLPTTIFLLLGVWAYGKSDPALRERLLNHPRFGHSLRLWVDKRQITRRGKWLAGLGIAASALFTAAVVGPKPVTYAVVLGLGALIVYLATRNEPA